MSLVTAWNWVSDLTSHFRVQYLVLLLLISILFLSRKRPVPAVMSLLFAGINLFPLLPFLFGAAPAMAGNPAHRVLMVNLHHYENDQYGKVRQLIRTQEPEVILFLEVTEKWTEMLRGELGGYPYSKVAPREDAMGIGLFSRLELKDLEIGPIGETNIPSVLGRMKVGSKWVRVIGTHLMSPLTPRFTEDRNRQLGALQEVLNGEKGLKMVLGDFNLTPWSSLMKNFGRSTGLMDTRIGQGIKPTWPSMFPPLWIPIEHCMVSPEIGIHKFQIGPEVGSDHLPVILDFSIAS
ncbi:MAG: hypothetical protein COV67_11010 [Nitrospinae bacterium CG11_big_fil_rev_8_21_14_0_20_56_8]|nr:MAG: hypothetical protein COV67_11010 [Nitrospinae bacterium CG11_big_fil_rev_8_21_14_0_20_56_8]